MNEKYILSIESMRVQLEDRNLTAVSKATGVSRPVLYQIMARKTDPRYSTIERLSDYLMA
jgi:DNA-binding phage protein|tara:strand:+ start:371 stop:550 length:180 start_codon:yes stop_codon:yes gene_type:complete